MAEVVDSIIAELIARDNGYTAKMLEVVKVHDAVYRSGQKLSTMGDLGPSVERYADRHKKAATDIAASEEATTAKVVHTRKARADASVASDEKEVRSAKAAAKAKADVAIVEAERSARYRALAERAVASRSIPQSTSGRIGATVANEASGQRSIPAAVMAGGASVEVAAEAEINHLLADQAILRSALGTASAADKAVIRDKLDALRLEASLRRAGVAEAEILLALEERSLRVEAERAVVGKKQTGGKGLKSAEQFARGAGAYAAIGGPAAIAGLAVAAGAAAAVEGTESGIDFAKDIANAASQLTIGTKQLQVYQQAARDAGLTNEQLRSSFAHLNDELGKAEEGDKAATKLFSGAGLNVDVSQFKSLGDALPTILDRISKIPNAMDRAAIETKLFGEEGRRLDPFLKGGTKAVDELTAAMERNGSILSDHDIAALKEASVVLGNLKTQLSVDLSRVVAANKDAILELAKSFAALADSALKALASFSRIRAQNDYDNSNPNTPERAQAFKSLLTDPRGRDFLHGRLRTEIHNLPKDTPTLTVNGRPDTATRNAYIQQQGSKLLDQYRQVLFYKPPPEVVLAPVQGGNPGSLKGIFSGDGRKGKSAETLAKEADARAKRFEDELARANDEYLAAHRELALGAEERLAIDQATLKTDHDRRDQDITREANEKQIDKSKVDELKAANDKVFAEKRAVLALQHAVELQNQINDLHQLELSTQIGTLQSRQALAETAKERRELGAQILEKEKQAESDRLKAIVNSNDPSISDRDRALAGAQLKTIDQRYREQGQQNARQNQGPWQQYLSSLPSTANQIEEAFERAAVNGVDRLNDSLADSLTKMIGLHGVAGEFLNDLIKIGLQAAESALFGGGSGAGNSSGGGGGGLFSSIISAAGTIFGGARAGGGPVSAGKSYLVGERGPEIVHMGGSGTVYPNGSLPNLMGGGGGTTIVQHFTLDARYGITTPELLEHVNVVASQRAAEAGQASYRASVAAVPSTMARYQNEKG